ncbi:MAG: hypothetical protein AAF768_06615 [Pseudomonadota bacterium]
MRCSNCMSVLVEDGTSLKCPSCGLVLDLDESFEAPTPLDDPYIKASFNSGSSENLNLGRYAFYGLAGAVLLGLGVGIGWFGQSFGSDEALPEAPLTSVETTGEIFQSVNSEVSGGQPILQTDLPFLDLIATNDPEVNGLVLIGSRAVRDTARSQGNARFALSFDRDGRLRNENSIGPVAEGTVVSALGDPAGDMVFAIKRRSTVSIISQTVEGQQLWSRDFPSAEEKGFDASLYRLGDGTVAILPGEGFDELAVLMIGADSYIDWQRQLPSALGTSAVGVLTPFDEIVIASESISSSGDRVLHLSSLSRAGQLVMSERVVLRQDQDLLAITVDQNGVTHMLLSGAVPRVLSVDALGRTIGDIALPIAAAMEDTGNCAIRKSGTELKVSCLEETGLNTASYETIVGTASSSMLSFGAVSGDELQFLAVTNDHIAFTTPRPDRSGMTARVIPLEAGPAFRLNDLPEVDLTQIETVDTSLTAASTNPAEAAGIETTTVTGLTQTDAAPVLETIEETVDPIPVETEPLAIETDLTASETLETDSLATFENLEGEVTEETAAADVLTANTDFICRFVCTDPGDDEAIFTLSRQQTFTIGTALADIEIIAAAQSSDLCTTIQSVPALDQPVTCSAAP